MRTRLVLLGMVALALFCVGGAGLAPADGVFPKSSQAASAVGDVGAFMVTVDIGEVRDFDAGQFDLSFDRSALRLDSITSGRIGGTEVPIAGWAELDATTLRVVVNVPGIEGVTGEGSLAVLHFTAVDGLGGLDEIALLGVFLNDSRAEELETELVLTGSATP